MPSANGVSVTPDAMGSVLIAAAPPRKRVGVPPTCGGVPPPHRFVPRKRAVPPLHRRRRQSLAPLLLIASLCIVADAAHADTGSLNSVSSEPSGTPGIRRSASASAPTG